MSKPTKPIALFTILLSISVLFMACDKTIEEHWNNGNIKTSIQYLNSDRTLYKYCEYFDNGQLKIETIYSNGLLNGEYKHYFRNGQLKLKRTFLMGKIDGLEQSYNEKGEILHQSLYKNSVLISSKSFITEKSNTILTHK